MKKMCLGTYLKILTQCKKDRVTQKFLIHKIFSYLKHNINYEEDSFQGHLISGKNNYTDTDELINFDKDKLIDHFKKNVIPLLDETLHKKIILAFKDVLRDDTIDELATIGFENEGYRKNDIINNTYFNLEETLANVFYYCAISVKNTTCKENIKQIRRDYIVSLTSKDEHVYFEQISRKVLSNIEPTLNKKEFDKVFYKIKTNNLQNPNPNEIEIYSLDILNSSINYDALKTFIYSNISNYVLSRATMNSYILSGKQKNITSDAIRAYNKKIKKSSETNHFSEIMLYSFLECVLKAPKIFSKMELQNKSGEYNTFSSGIHVLSLKMDLVPFNQFIFGASSTVESLEQAIDKCFEQIYNINSINNEENILLQTTILNKKFDTKTSNILYEMIMPQKAGIVNKPENAFGVFLSYSINISGSNISNYEYKALMQEKMESDLNHITLYIDQKLKELNLTNYSFYIYILPLNDANIDKDKIMKEALEV